MSGDPVTRDDVVRAAETIRGRVRRTPLLDGSALAPGLALKAELFQHTGSFKARGVTNRLAALSADERERGVAGASAGNHAIALAWGAAARGARLRRLLWSSASPFKLDRARALGARIDSGGRRPLRGVRPPRGAPGAKTGATLVHPFDDPLVMAGQGTVGLEILEDAPACRRGRRARRRRGARRPGSPPPSRRAASASSASSPRARRRSLRGLEAGEPVPVAPETIAGGLDAPFAGTRALEVCAAAGVEVVTVSDDADRGGDAPPLRRREARVRARRRGRGGGRSRGCRGGRLDRRRRLREATSGPKSPLVSWPVDEGGHPSRVRRRARHVLVRQRVHHPLDEGRAPRRGVLRLPSRSTPASRS